MTYLQQHFQCCESWKITGQTRKAGDRWIYSRWIRSWLNRSPLWVMLKGKWFGWRVITTGVPQRWVLGPILFNIFISSLAIRTRFADDEAGGQRGAAYMEKDQMVIQNDLDPLVEWSITHARKCNGMHLGTNNMTIRAHTLETTDKDRDLDILENCRITMIH